MIKITTIVGVIEIGLVSVIMIFSCFSLFIAFRRFSHLGSMYSIEPTFLYMLIHVFQPLFFGFYGIITFIIGLVGALRLRKEKFRFSYIGLSLVTVWSFVVFVIAIFGRYSQQP